MARGPDGQRKPERIDMVRRPGWIDPYVVWVGHRAGREDEDEDDPCGPGTGSPNHNHNH